MARRSLQIYFQLGALLWLTACASTPSVKHNETFGDVPTWYINPGEGATDEEVCGVGSYRAGDLDYTRMQAVANARADLSSLLRAKVDQAVRNTFSEVTKTLPDADLTPLDRVGDAFRQTLASEGLAGSSIKDTFISKNGTVYVRVAMPKASIWALLDKTISQTTIRQIEQHSQEVENRFRQQLDVLPWNAR